VASDGAFDNILFRNGHVEGQVVLEAVVIFGDVQRCVAT